MTLTFANGPLAAGAPSTVNYEIHGPPHKILFSAFPRRVRATFAGETVLDTDRGMLLHESNILPVLYVPEEDVRAGLLQRTDHSTHCPFKGDASYWSISVGGRTSENAAWGYEAPNEDVPWLKGYLAMYWDRLDRWFDEDEEVFGHLRDPYHRIDVRPSSRRVRVAIGGTEVADTGSAQVLSEGGFPNRYYIPAVDVRVDMFVPSDAASHCPYKGDARYWSRGGDAPAPDVAWSYPEPFDGALRIADHWCFHGDDVSIEVS